MLSLRLYKPDLGIMLLAECQVAYCQRLSVEFEGATMGYLTGFLDM